jgi:parallel beta-helix repeat protein
MNRKIAVLVLALVLILSLVVIIVEIPIPVRAGTIYVDDDYGSEDPTHKKTIQAGVDNATPGDTIYVYSGVYSESVDIDKTLTLTGEDKNTTIIMGDTSNIGIYGHNANNINIFNFTIKNTIGGIKLHYSNFSQILNNKIINNERGIFILYSNGSIVKENNVSYQTNFTTSISDYYGIKVEYSNYTLIENNTCRNNKGNGIILENANNNTVNHNFCIYNGDNFHVNSLFGASSFNIISNNIFNNSNGSWTYSVGVGIFSSDNVFINNKIDSNKYGIASNWDNGNIIINSSILNSEVFDIRLLYQLHLVLLNTSFNRSSVYYEDFTAKLEVQWYLHINVIDYLGNPVPSANIKVEDSKNSSNEEFFTTDANGYLKWLTATEYIEQDINGDNIGEKTYHTPHKIVAWNDTLVGYAQPVIDESKTVTIVLHNGTLMDLEPGWNLVSLPRIQADTNLPTVLQSIEGQYDAVQWYNATDSKDPWKHHHISKPSYLNDLVDINHPMGFWVHVTDPGGATLVVFGDVLVSTQNITLYPGWNLVGYPSTTDKTRTLALNNLFFDTDVDAIWTHNATTQKWKEITASDNFEVGRGYWIHAKNKVTWIVPL